jgi:hypothetical protein
MPALTVRLPSFPNPPTVRESPNYSLSPWETAGVRACSSYPHSVLSTQYSILPAARPSPRPHPDRTHRTFATGTIRPDPSFWRPAARTNRTGTNRSTVSGSQTLNSPIPPTRPTPSAHQTSPPGAGRCWPSSQSSPPPSRPHPSPPGGGAGGGVPWPRPRRYAILAAIAPAERARRRKEAYPC